jgi:hypothetical protein
MKQKKGYAAEPSGKAVLHCYETQSTPTISFGTAVPIHQEQIREADASSAKSSEQSREVHAPPIVTEA